MLDQGEVVVSITSSLTSDQTHCYHDYAWFCAAMCTRTGDLGRRAWTYTPRSVPIAQPNIGKMRLSFWSDMASSIADKATVSV
jgi:hypothetical protein